MWRCYRLGCVSEIAGPSSLSATLFLFLSIYFDSFRPVVYFFYFSLRAHAMISRWRRRRQYEHTRTYTRTTRRAYNELYTLTTTRPSPRASFLLATDWRSSDSVTRRLDVERAQSWRTVFARGGVPSVADFVARRCTVNGRKYVCPSGETASRLLSSPRDFASNGGVVHNDDGR